eukprot:10030446-Alexandrium_andersonii.AAC.1
MASSCCPAVRPIGAKPKKREREKESRRPARASLRQGAGELEKVAIPEVATLVPVAASHPARSPTSRSTGRRASTLCSGSAARGSPRACVPSRR